MSTRIPGSAADACGSVPAEVADVPQDAGAAPAQTARRVAFVCVAAASALLLWVGIGSYGLCDTDEAKHAEIAREMYASGALIEPTINFSPYRQKPSPLYLVMGFCYRLLGPTELAARLPAALSCLLTLLAVYWYASSPLISGRLGGDVRAGCCAAFLLASLVFFIAVGRYANFDAPLTLMVSCAALQLAWWSACPERKTRVPVGLYVAILLGVLVKGPAAVVLLALPMAATVVVGDLSWRELRAGRGLAMVCGLAGTWFVVAWSASPDYVTEFLWKHNLVRFFAARGTADLHPASALYFVPVLVAGLLPWSLIAAPALVWALRRGGPDRVLAIYSVWVVVFFSMSAGKLAPYVLPAFPTTAVVVARWLLGTGGRAAATERYHRLVSIEAALLVLLVPAAVIVIADRAPSLLSYAAVSLPAAGAGVVVLASGRLRSASLLVRQVTLAAGTVALSLCWNLWAAPAASDVVSDKALARVATASERPERVVGFHVLPHSFQFYTGWPITYHVSDDQYREALGGDAHVVVVTKPGRLDELRALVPERAFHELARTPRHVLLATR